MQQVQSQLLKDPRQPWVSGKNIVGSGNHMYGSSVIEKDLACLEKRKDVDSLLRADGIKSH